MQHRGKWITWATQYRGMGVVAAGLMLMLWTAERGPAATLTVTSLADHGPGTLRQAILDAAPGDTVVFAVTGTISILGSSGPEAAELTISKDLSIAGPGKDQLLLTYPFPTRVRPYFLTASNALVTLSDLSISGGPYDLMITTAGGATLTVSNCIARDNTTFQNFAGCRLRVESSQLLRSRVALENYGGFLSVSSSTLASNLSGFIARAVPGGSNWEGGTNVFVNSTFSGNGRALSCVRGIHFFTNCTISGNVASSGVAGLEGALMTGSAVRLFNTILAGNRNAGGTSPDCRGALDSLDYNLIGNTNGCVITNLTSHNIYGVDPKLGALGDCEGLTPTMPPAFGSPALDAGSPTDAPAVDQRGRPRPFGASSDIGAVESCPPYVLAGRVSGFTLREEIDLDVNLTNMISTCLGNFRLFGVAPGTYSVSPLNTNYLFIPSNRLIFIGPDCTDADFKAYRWNCLSFEGFTSNAMKLAFPGDEGQTLQLLGSSDLGDWLPVATNTVPGSRLLEFAAPRTNSIQFYRALIQ